MQRSPRFLIVDSELDVRSRKRLFFLWLANQFWFALGGAIFIGGGTEALREFWAAASHLPPGDSGAIWLPVSGTLMALAAWFFGGWFWYEAFGDPLLFAAFGSRKVAFYPARPLRFDYIAREKRSLSRTRAHFETREPDGGVGDFIDEFARSWWRWPRGEDISPEWKNLDRPRFWACRHGRRAVVCAILEGTLFRGGRRPKKKSPDAQKS